MSPMELLAWVGAVSASVIFASIAIAVLVSVVKTLGKKGGNAKRIL